MTGFLLSLSFLHMYSNSFRAHSNQKQEMKSGCFHFHRLLLIATKVCNNSTAIFKVLSVALP